MRTWLLEAGSAVMLGVGMKGGGYGMEGVPLPSTPGGACSAVMALNTGWAG